MKVLQIPKENKAEFCQIVSYMTFCDLMSKSVLASSHAGMIYLL
jgi:hypothetical protein